MSVTSGFRPQNWSEEALDQAVAWHVELSCESADEEVKTAWQAWYQQSPEHRQAWQQLEAMNSQLRQVGRLGRQTLEQAEQRRRRRLLKGVLSLALLAPPLWWLSKTSLWRAARADIATPAGEIRSLQLPDGSEITLNTSTQVNLHFSAQVRQIELLGGEIYLSTAKDPRPLSVITEVGDVLALGTEFSVYSQQQQVSVVLISGEVAIKPNTGKQLLLKPGQRADFDANSTSQAKPLDDLQLSWLKGVLRVDNWRLDTFCSEISRYLPGKVYCAQSVADLPISGSFPLDDPLYTLSSLAKILPVSVQSFGPYWHSVSAAQETKAVHKPKK